MAISYKSCVNVLDFGADPTGTIDSTAAFNAAIAAFPNGAEIEITGTFLINGTVLAQNNISLRGVFGSPPMYIPGSTLPVPYNVAPTSVLNLGPSATISLGFGCSISGAILFSTQTFNNPSTLTFTGTAIAIPGSAGLQIQDVGIRNCGIFGFNTAIAGSYVQRLRCVDLNIDCLNGVEIDHSYDTDYLERVKLWPFLNYFRSGYALSTRQGTAFAISGCVGSWHQVVNCGAIGWLTGVHDTNCGTNVYRGCQFDMYGVGGRGSGQVAFNIDGPMTGAPTLIEDCQSGVDTLFAVNVSGSSNVFPAVVIDNFIGWAGNIAGTSVFAISSGYVHAHRVFAQSYHGIGVTNGFLSNYENILGQYGPSVVGIGALALANVGDPAQNDIAIGYGALNSNTSGSNNVGIGTNALNAISVNSNSAGIGASALLQATGGQNTGIGAAAGDLLVTGSGCTFIGFNAQPLSTGDVNEIVVGSNATGKGNNSAFIAGTAYNGANTTTWAIVSDIRIKDNISELSDSLKAICGLRPVAFTYKADQTSDIGFIAQEYKSVFPDQVHARAPSLEERAFVSDGELLVIQQNLVPHLVRAVQELAERVKNLERIR